MEDTTYRVVQIILQEKTQNQERKCQKLKYKMYKALMSKKLISKQ